MRGIIKVLVVVLGIHPLSSWADPSMNDYYTQGQALSQSPELKISGPTDASKVPGYQDPSTLSQTSIKETTIDSQVKKVTQENQEAALIQETYNTRPQFDFDVKADPLFTNADDIIANPEKILEVKGHEQSTEIKVTRHQCTKGYDFFEKRCRWAKVPKQNGTKQEVRIDHVYVKGTKKPFYIKDFHLNSRKEGTKLYPTYLLWFSNDRENPQWKKDATSPSVIESFKVLFNGTDAISGQVFRINANRIISAKHIKNSGGYYVGSDHHGYHWEAFSENTLYSEQPVHFPAFLLIEVKHMIDIPVFKLEDDMSNCADLEAITDQGTCEYTSKYCVEGPSTKIIEGVPVYSDCWAEEAVYQCRTQLEDKCKALAQQGCAQIGSKCTIEEGEGDQKRCFQWQQTYECYEGGQLLNKTTLNGKKPFCLDGDCANQSWAPNQDMAEALSKLAIFKEMQKDMEANAKTVFKGKPLGCSRIPVSFKDCCKQNGWGKSIGLASCNGDEKELAEQRKLNKCILVGTYCAEKVLGVCVRKKTSFCCYQSKLAKIIHEQGKAQLGLSFGSPEEPQCEGLTLEQLTRIDFSKIDLSELFDEIFAKTKIPNTSNITSGIQKSLSDKTYFNTDKEKKITQGKAHGTF